MTISFANENIHFVLPEKRRIRRWIQQICEQQGKRVGEIGYLFCDDTYLLQANLEYLNHDTLTDIITFDYVEGDEISGDIMISVERVRENAGKFATPFEQELHRVMIHGVLHLLGQGDKSDAGMKQMRKREEEALSIWKQIE